MSEQSSANGDEHARDGSLYDELDDEGLLADDLEYGLSDHQDEGPNWGLLIGVTVALAAIVFLVFDGIQAETYFFDVHNAVERGDELIGETIRVRGHVESGSFEGEPGMLESRFDIATEGESMSIVYHRALPDTFEEDSEIVAEGRLDEEFVLHADEVLVKCPSRYEGAPPTEGGYGDDYDDAQESSDPQASR